MEPLTCLSIACSVMQIISFSHEVYSLVRRIKKDGTVDKELREHIGFVSESSKGLKGHLESIDHQQMAGNQLKLKEVASKCLKTSTDIRDQLDKIDKSRGGMRILVVIRSRKALERLERVMQGYQNDLQNGILVNLCTRDEAAKVLQTTHFKILDSKLQDFIAAYSQGQTELKHLIVNEVAQNRSLIQNGTQETRKLIVAQEQLELRKQLEARRERLLGSLKDSNMNARRNQIDGADGSTFDSVFNHDSKNPWSNFTNWLRSEENLYWISGKAGSGKSTLLKFLAEDARTEELLHQWKPDCKIYTHFIWNSGSPSQRSIGGLLRSLLHQILSATISLLDILLQDNSKLLGFTSTGDWSRSELENCLYSTLSLHERGACVFIDGLDEIDANEGAFDIVEFVTRLSAGLFGSRIKLCASSRPELSFIKAFEEVPKLRLQDLTRPDMRAYVEKFLHKEQFFLKEAEKFDLVKLILDKADGVFLWITLALKSLQRGIVHNDDTGELMERLNILPSRLEDLYENMLKRSGDDIPLYRKQAALYFNTAIALQDLSSYNGKHKFFIFTVAADTGLREKLLAQKPTVFSSQVEDNLLAMARRLRSRCAGLLEVSSLEENLLTGNDYSVWAKTNIQFIHRSAKEFLLSKKDTLLALDATSSTERAFNILQGLILVLLYAHDGIDPLEFDAAIRSMDRGAVFSLPALRKSEILNLMKDVFHASRVPYFYDIAASYGYFESLEILRGKAAVDQSALKNYLLLCSGVQAWPRPDINNPFLNHLMAIGADPNVIRVQWTAWKIESEGFVLGLVQPYLSIFPDSQNNITDTECEEKLSSCIRICSDIQYKFLVWIYGARILNYYDNFWYRNRHYLRPVAAMEVTLVEGNMAYIIHNVIWEQTADAAKRMAIASRIGFDTTKVHYQALLMTDYKSAPHTVRDEYSKILLDPQIKLPEVDQLDLEQKMRGEKVSDVYQWLIDGGHAVLKRGPSEFYEFGRNASFEEMAMYYWELNKKYGLKSKAGK